MCLSGRVEVADRFHTDRGQYAYGLVDGFEGRLQCQGVDHRGEHAHLVTLDAVETALCPREAAEDITATDDDGYLYALLGDRFYLLGIVRQTLGINALFAFCGETLTREFKKNALKHNS